MTKLENLLETARASDDIRAACLSFAASGPLVVLPETGQAWIQVRLTSDYYSATFADRAELLLRQFGQALAQLVPEVEGLAAAVTYRAAVDRPGLPSGHSYRLSAATPAIVFHGKMIDALSRLSEANLGRIRDIVSNEVTPAIQALSQRLATYQKLAAEDAGLQLNETDLD